MFIYIKNHIEQAKEQCGRRPMSLPNIELRNINILNGEFDYDIVNYNSHPTIKAPLSNLKWMEEKIIEFIQRYYVIEKRVGDIYLRDMFDKGDKETYMFDITPDVKFFWGKAKKVTGVNLYSKEYNHIPKIIREVF